MELPLEQKTFIHVIFCINNKSYMCYLHSNLTLKWPVQSRPSHCLLALLFVRKGITD